MGDSWRFHGVSKWIAYDRVSGEVVGRGGLSRTPVGDDWGQIYRFLPAEPWVRALHESRRPFIGHAHWLEIGWALRREFWGSGYASEIGRAGLAFAFDVLGGERGGVLHGPPQLAFARRNGAHRHAVCGRNPHRGMVEGFKKSRTTHRTRSVCCCEEAMPADAYVSRGVVSDREEGTGGAGGFLPAFRKTAGRNFPKPSGAAALSAQRCRSTLRPAASPAGRFT